LIRAVCVASIGQARTLADRRAGSVYEAEVAETQVESVKAQLDAAEFNLEITEVRAPADGPSPSLGCAKARC
jgi:multidrug resistance efflux pump